MVNNSDFKNNSKNKRRSFMMISYYDLIFVMILHVQYSYVFRQINNMLME